ncbi:MAG: hypothetical protein JWQ23_1630 [Herminiimonas sp.]|nr:hypothetical protein [Herminiimonas sp.]
MSRVLFYVKMITRIMISNKVPMPIYISISSMSWSLTVTAHDLDIRGNFAAALYDIARNLS